METPVLKLPVDKFDLTATFLVSVPDKYSRHKIGAVTTVKAYLYYSEIEGKFFAFKINNALRNPLSEEMKEEIKRLSSFTPIGTGDEVFIVDRNKEIHFYNFQALGDYPTCGVFTPVPVSPAFTQYQTQVKEIDYTKLAELADLAADKLEIIDDEQYRALANQIRDLLA